MNEAILVGNLARDPELKWIGKDNCVAKFQIATNERWLDKDGNKVEKTDWHNCSAWGKKAEAIHKYVKKGDKILVKGKIRNNNFEKEGIKVYGYEIVVENFEFCGGGKKGENNSDIPPQNDNIPESPSEQPAQRQQKSPTPKGKQENVNGNNQDDDIPF